MLGRGPSPCCPLCQRPGQRMWLPSHGQHEQRWSSLTLWSLPALLTTASLLATYSSSSWHFLSSKHINNLRSPCRIVPSGAGSIHMPHRLPACSSGFPTLLSPRFQACFLQCPEIPQMCPQLLSLFLWPRPCLHPHGQQPVFTALQPY